MGPGKGPPRKAPPLAAIQIGIRTPLLKEYAREIVRMIDMSEVINKVKQAHNEEDKISMLPFELPYPRPEGVFALDSDVTLEGNPVDYLEKRGVSVNTLWWS